ncbi:MAG: alpha/beta hydrolase [Clostridia bacterium]|nr:alpha/beta hydrolase [Clostridia bacterium]
MNINIQGHNINYEIHGEQNDKHILILHGWGANIASFAPVTKQLSVKFKVHILDLPGFGESDEPKGTFFVEDYANIVLEFIQKLNIEKPVLIGHSFGGRIIMKLVGKLGFEPDKIIFVDSAGIKPKRGLDYYFKVYSYKLAKKTINLIFSKEKATKLIADMRNKKGSTDYNNASENLKKTFINVVNEDLRHHLPNIKVPTLLIWGEKDMDTPLRDAKIIERLVPDAGLVVFKGAGHYSYLENLHDFVVITTNFIEGDSK